MTKHTPGPWTMHPRFDDLTLKNDGAEVRALLAPVAWCSVASTHGASGSQSIDAAEARANARLIAAAPDLLEALEKLYRAVSDVTSSVEDLGYGEELARAAIAKAKGDTDGQRNGGK